MSDRDAVAIVGLGVTRQGVRLGIAQRQLRLDALGIALDRVVVGVQTERAGEATIIGKEQKTLSVDVQPTHRQNSRQVVG